MRAYAWAWRQLAAMYCVVGLVLAGATMGWTSTAVLIGSGIAFGVLASVTYASVREYPVIEWVWTSLATGCFTVGFIGTIAVFGLRGLLAGVLLGVTAPRMLCLVRAAVTDPPSLREIGMVLHGSSPSPASNRDLEVDPGRLSDTELCGAWRRSTVRLQWVRTASERLELTVLRGKYLDELERRDPRGFQNWLATSPGASSNPYGHLRRGGFADEPPLDLG